MTLRLQSRVPEHDQAEAAVAGVPTPILSSPPSKRWWPDDEKGWTSDASWGCMLRTQQSLLQALLATALILKELLNDVGEWFGRGTTADAINLKSLVQSFPDASLGISVAVDGHIFKTNVYLASHTSIHASYRDSESMRSLWRTICSPQAYHTRATVPLRLPTQTTEPADKQLLLGRRLNPAGANGGGSVPSGEASDDRLATQMHHVTSLGAPEVLLRARAKCRSQGSIRACSLVFYARGKRTSSTQSGRTAVVVADNSLESMSDPEDDEDDKPVDKDSLGSSAGDGDGERDVVADVIVDGDGDGDARKDEEEDSSDVFLNTGEGAAICDQISYAQPPRAGKAAAAPKTTPSVS
ncbi:hypothetical protein V8E53_007482 [Lactarius tabidus]